MCDTIAATGSATADGITLFGKNSDREPRILLLALQRLAQACSNPFGSTRLRGWTNFRQAKPLTRKVFSGNTRCCIVWC